MKQFTSVKDIDKLPELIEEAFEVKKNPFAFKQLGENKTMGLFFLNPSLRTRLSTQKAAFNLGMNCMVFNLNNEGWSIETKDGVVMNGNAAEHIKDAVAVMGQYCDVMGIRSFANLQNRSEDYAEIVLNNFLKYANTPIVSMESATLHPLQSLADIITIEEHKKTAHPKVVLSWAPHPRALPQAVANSFAEWTVRAGYELVITHPEGYELDPQFSKGAIIEYDQKKAFEGADFVYAKNWSSYQHYGQILNQNPAWTVSEAQMQQSKEAFFMHCLPVRRNVVVTDQVIDSSHSLILQQAANRVVSAQTILKKMLENS